MKIGENTRIKSINIKFIFRPVFFVDFEQKNTSGYAVYWKPTILTKLFLCVIIKVQMHLKITKRRKEANEF